MEWQQGTRKNISNYHVVSFLFEPVMFPWPTETINSSVESPFWLQYCFVDRHLELPLAR